MFSKIYTGIFIVSLVLFVCGCNVVSDDDKQVCKGSIQISVSESSTNQNISGYKLYEVTNYPEGIIMNIQSVSEKYIHKDSSGMVCLPLLSEQSADMIRKFVMIKPGYVYTEYHLKNTIIDTILSAIKLNDDK